MKKKIPAQLPKSSQLENALKYERYKHRYRKTLRSTTYTLITVAAAAVLVATLWMPVLQIYGASMSPTLYEGDIVISLKATEFQQGDIVAFYYGNKLLVKRCIACSGAWVDLSEDGTVSVDSKILEEPYIDEKSYGNADITFPYQVPEERIFLMGDHRSTSVDSRHAIVGCISEEYVIGKIVFRVWPLDRFGPIS
jgi:signal peptidase I